MRIESDDQRGLVDRQGGDRKCFSCGRPGAAFWRGDRRPLTVCQRCAVTVLPALIADAAPLSRCANWQKHADQVEHVLDRVKSAYWQAMTSRFIREQCDEQHGGAREQCMDCGDPVEVEGRELCFACYSHHQG